MTRRAKNEINFLHTYEREKNGKWKVEYFIRGSSRLVGIAVSNCVQVHQETSKKVQKKNSKESVDDF